MLTYPKSTMCVWCIQMHLSSGHLTLMPGKFYPPPLISPKSDLGRRADSRWALPQISSFILIFWVCVYHWQKAICLILCKAYIVFVAAVQIRRSRKARHHHLPPSCILPTAKWRSRSSRSGKSHLAFPTGKTPRSKLASVWGRSLSALMFC